MRLAERGVVETAWETPPPAGRSPRHLYRLSGAGARLAEELRKPSRRRSPTHALARFAAAHSWRGVVMPARLAAWIVGALALAVVLSLVAPGWLVLAVFTLAVPSAVVAKILAARHPKGDHNRDGARWSCRPRLL